MSSGIDFTILHFGSKLFGYMIILKLWTNLHPKTTAINLYLRCGQQSWMLRYLKATEGHNHK
jgi:hypothetical protein